MIKAYAGRKQYVDKKGLDLLDKAIDKMMKEDIALDELEEQMFGDKEEGLTGIDRRDMKKIVREYYSRKDKTQVLWCSLNGLDFAGWIVSMAMNTCFGLLIGRYGE